MGQELRLLIVEDSEFDAALLILELKKGGYDVTHHRVQTEEDMLAALREQSWDLIISDYSMPRFSAHAALAVAKEHNPDVPFIVVSGTVGEDVAVEVMRAGAQDFMSKSRLARLLPAIKRSMRESASHIAHRAIAYLPIDAVAGGVGQVGEEKAGASSGVEEELAQPRDAGARVALPP